MPVPTKAADRFFQMLPDVAKRSEGRKRWGLRFDTPEKFQSTIRDYYRLITGLDREVGRIVSLLKERAIDGNTVIIFEGDNGFFFGERGMADKWLMYEESIRVPLIVCDPRLGARAGTTCDAMALNIDIAPTLLELAGLPAPTVMQGRSLVPLIRGETPNDWRADFFYEHHANHHLLKNPIPATEGVRGERWKYTQWMDTEPLVEELYDLKTDPEELTNLLSKPDAAPELKRLRERWAQLAAELK
jgi:arylsulfatase A-like enzyme